MGSAIQAIAELLSKIVDLLSNNPSKRVILLCVIMTITGYNLYITRQALTDSKEMQQYVYELLEATYNTQIQIKSMHDGIRDERVKRNSVKKRTRATTAKRKSVRPNRRNADIRRSTSKVSRKRKRIRIPTNQAGRIFRIRMRKAFTSNKQQEFTKDKKQLVELVKKLRANNISFSDEYIYTYDRDFEVVEIKENDVEFNTLKVMDIEERKPSKKIFNDKVNEVELNDLIENLDEYLEGDEY